MNEVRGPAGRRLAITRDASVREQLVLGKINTVISCSPLDEALALRVLGQRDRIIGERRRHLPAGLARVADWMETNSAYAELDSPQCGSALLVRLKPSVFDAASVACFYAALERDGVRVASGSWFGDERASSGSALDRLTYPIYMTGLKSCRRGSGPQRL